MAGNGRGDFPSCILLDAWGYAGVPRGATTAWVVFSEKEVAIVSRGDGSYVVAILRVDIFPPRSFTLHRFHSSSGGTPGCWTSTVLTVEDPLREKVCPVPDTPQTIGFHRTTKVITLRGWVDLWRGIILCDVLSGRPTTLRDVPLPLPARRNRKLIRKCDPRFFRDITVNQLKDTIKYVEMTIRPRDVPITPYNYFPNILPGMCGAGKWKATFHTMPIPVTSWKDWEPGCSVSSSVLDPPDDNKSCKLLLRLVSYSKKAEEEEEEDDDDNDDDDYDDDKEEEETWLSLRSLQMAHPALSLNGDHVVYMLCQGSSKRRSLKAVVAVDMKEGVLKGMAKIDTSRHFSFNRHYFACGLPKCVKARRR
ncbi:hypothetical protein PR202_ga27123 [Eleusine coracana subsp. coracana]|uniref:DUF1618 domain-containing protein n=1 Tax=Eleusine coracana subsp. coracana TaxID=191504 RepID=A0AAV5DFY1_ELECO|nr:hypothetical protein PR202_ga27123 [Eleusine coracana subsp. coracana]